MAWALVSGATFRRFDSSPIPRRADVLETGDFGGTKLSGLPARRAAADRVEPASLFQAFCALFGPKQSGDEAVTLR